MFDLGRSLDVAFERFGAFGFLKWALLASAQGSRRQLLGLERS